jgi:hypothetical protein
MFRHSLAVAATLLAAGCGGAPAEPSGAVMAGPAMEAASAACEPKYADHTLTSLAALAECERDVALPRQQQESPALAGMFSGLWHDKIDLYAKVDHSELSRTEADRKLAIEADNWFNNIRSARRF